MESRASDRPSHATSCRGADRGVDVESIRERLEFRVFEKRAVERDVELAGVAKLVVKSRVDGHLLRLGFRRRHKAEQRCEGMGCGRSP